MSAPCCELLEPVPVSETVSAPVEKFTVSLPVLLPPTVGANVTVTAQLLPAATEAVHVVVSAKSPVTVMLLTPTAPPLALVTVTVCPALTDPTATMPKFSDDADSETGALPVPLRLTF